MILPRTFCRYGTNGISQKTDLIIVHEHMQLTAFTQCHVKISNKSDAQYYLCSFVHLARDGFVRQEGSR
jgi:hypothetical protein